MSEDHDTEIKERTSQTEVLATETPRNSDSSQLVVEETPTPSDRKDSKSLDHDGEPIYRSAKIAKALKAAGDPRIKLMHTNIFRKLGLELSPPPEPNPEPPSIWSGFLTRFLPAFALFASFGALNLIVFGMLPLLVAIAPTFIGSISAAVLYRNSKSKLSFGLFLGGLALITLGLPFLPFLNPESLVLLQVLSIAAAIVGLISTALGSYYLYKNEPTTLQFDDSPNHADAEIGLQEELYLVEEIENAVELSLENGAQHVLALNHDAAAVAFHHMAVNGKQNSVEILLAVMFRMQPTATQAIFSKLQAHNKAFITKDLITLQANFLARLPLKDATQELVKICQAAPNDQAGRDQYENETISPLFQKLMGHRKNLDKILLVLWSPRAAGSLTLKDEEFAHFVNTLVFLSSQNPYLSTQLIQFTDTLKATSHLQHLKKFLCNEKYREGASQLLVLLGTRRAATLMHVVLNDYSENIDRTGNIQKNSVTQLINELSRQGHSLEAARLLRKLQETDQAWAQKYVDDLTNPENLPAKILDILAVNFKKELVDALNAENMGRVAAFLKALVPAEPILVKTNKEYKTALAKEWSNSAPIDEKKKTSVTAAPEQWIELLQEAVIAAAIAESKAKRKYIDSNHLRETLKFLTLKVLTLFDAKALQSLPSDGIKTFGEHLYTLMSASTLDHEDPKKTLHRALAEIPFQSRIPLFGRLKHEFRTDARCLTPVLLAFTQFPRQDTRKASATFLQYLKFYENQPSLRAAFRNLATDHADQTGKFLSDVLWYIHEDQDWALLVKTLADLIQHEHAYEAAILIASIYKHRPGYGHELIKSLFDPNQTESTKRSEFLRNLLQFHPEYAVEMMRPLLKEVPSASLINDLNSLVKTHPGLIIKLCIHHPDIAEKARLSNDIIAEHLDRLISTHISEANAVMRELINTHPSRLKVILSSPIKHTDLDVKSTPLLSEAPKSGLKEKKISVDFQYPAGGLGVALNPETVKKIKGHPGPILPLSIGALMAYSVQHQDFYEAAVMFKLLFEDRRLYSDHKKILYTLCETLSHNELHDFVDALKAEGAYKKLMEILKLDLVLALQFIKKLEEANTKKVEVEPFKALLGGDPDTTLFARFSFTAFQGRRNIHRFLTRASNQECVDFFRLYDGEIGALLQRWARNHSEKASHVIQLFIQQATPKGCAAFINELEPSFWAGIKLKEMLNKIEPAKRQSILEGLNPAICEKAQLTELLLTANTQPLADKKDDSSPHPGPKGYDKKESLSVLLNMDTDVCPQEHPPVDQQIRLLQAALIKAAATRNITVLKTGDLLRLTTGFLQVVDSAMLPGTEDDIQVEHTTGTLTASLVLDPSEQMDEKLKPGITEEDPSTAENFISPSISVLVSEPPQATCEDDDTESITSKISTQPLLTDDSTSKEMFSQHLLEAMLAYASLKTTLPWEEALPDILGKMPAASRVFLFEHLKITHQENPKCLAAYLLGWAQNSSGKSIQDFPQEYLMDSHRNLLCDTFTELAKNKAHVNQIGKFLSQLPDEKGSSNPLQTAIMDMVENDSTQEAATWVASIYTYKPELACTIAASLLPQEVEQGYSGLSNVDSQPTKPDNRNFFLALKEHANGSALINILLTHPNVESKSKYFLKNLNASIDDEKKQKPIFEKKERTIITETTPPSTTPKQIDPSTYFNKTGKDIKSQWEDREHTLIERYTRENKENDSLVKSLMTPGVGFGYSSPPTQTPVNNDELQIRIIDLTKETSIIPPPS